MDNEIYIEEPLKSKLIAFGINLFLIFGLLFIPADSELLPELPNWYNQLDLYLTVVLTIPLLWQFRSLIKKTGIALSTHGIKISTNPMRDQSFSWKEITNIKFIKIFFLKYILIYIREPEVYLEKQNIFRKILMKSDIQKFGTPVKIPIHNISKTPHEIAQIISDYTKRLS